MTIQLETKASRTSSLITDPSLVITKSPNDFNRVSTYSIIFKNDTRPYILSHAFSGPGRYQFGVSHHGTGSQKHKYIKEVSVAIESVSAACTLVVDLIRITTQPANSVGGQWATWDVNGDSNPEMQLYSLPSTQATEDNFPIARIEYNLGATSSVSTINPPQPLIYSVLYKETGVGSEVWKNPTMRAGFDEGWAVTIDVDCAVTVKASVAMIWTEVLA